MLEELRRYFIFEPLPFISRVVFLATPHRGSDLSTGRGRARGHELDLGPRQHPQAAQHLVKENPDAFDPRRFRRFPTSIETLEYQLRRS